MSDGNTFVSNLALGSHKRPPRVRPDACCSRCGSKCRRRQRNDAIALGSHKRPPQVRPDARRSRRGSTCR
ncbi:hypothetical protein FR483_n839L [Paramecium bursaria Chlorella virus FR483]|uniref:Uncharacterized protein n839L n=1 Tax=Paramecium bursaria Chlorella virus FR483 TaxID=399781 RepID=A7J8J3_PBCVF|nr:hypothetical protein FR483_n839L [Paramecium bursaria Chlorella virus FR483]ABT16124.1 hypothetical protein FR483_n839L [Paramecium bursaria Chlorella virus FR483]